MKIWKRMRQWRRRAEFQSDLEEEMQFHREMAGGAAFGSMAMALEDSRAVWGFGWLDSVIRDVRYALRGFRKSPAFALAVVGTIGVALGINTTTFTVINAYALRPFAVHNPWALHNFTWYGKNGQGHRFTWAQYQDLAARKSPFSDVIAFENLGTGVGIGGNTLFGQLVSGNYFAMLGVGVAAGRPLLPRDAAEPGSAAVVVVSYDTWRNKFGADPDLVGQKLYLRGHPFEVVGIANPSFAGIECYPCSFWIPLTMHTAVLDGGDLRAFPQPERLKLIGRLQDGVPLDTAKAALAAWSSGVSAQLPADQRPVGVLLQSAATTIPLNRDAILTIMPFFIAFGLVLLIACANVSNMMLARALARQREIAIRVSLGAGRTRLIRQLLTESVLLAVPAAVLGLGISQLTIQVAQRALFATLPAALARILTLPELTPDWRVFAYILLTSVIATLVFGMVPALQTTRSRLVEANRGDFSSDYRPARLRSFLLTTQVAVCSLLLIMTAIVLRSQNRVTAKTIGLDLKGVWDITMPAKYQAGAAERMASMPGVEAVAKAWRAPLYGSDRQLDLGVSGSRATTRMGYNLVSPGYFPVFRLPILRGRGFTEAEAQTDTPVAVVSQTAARRLWPGKDAIGQTVSIPAAPERNPSSDRRPPFSEALVIGVAQDCMSGFLVTRADREGSMIYFPSSVRSPRDESLIVRLSDTSQGAHQRIAGALDGIAPGIYDQLTAMEDVLAMQIYPFQVIFCVSGFLGGLALLMTVSGIYGVMSFLVNQRTKEIGIRMALGAAAGDVVRMVVRQSARLALVGVAVGIALAMAIAPVFASQLEAIHPYDWMPYTAAILIVMAAAVAASFGPSRRAVRVDPVTALRCD